MDITTWAGWIVATVVLGVVLMVLAGWASGLLNIVEYGIRRLSGSYSSTHDDTHGTP